MQHVDGDRIEWSCDGCGDNGVVTGFSGGESDLSDFQPLEEVVAWGFDDEERELLTQATTEIPELRAIVARGCPHAEIEGLLVVEATVEELDEMYTLVEELTDIARSRKRIEMLVGLRASLSTSIDGF